MSDTSDVETQMLIDGLREELRMAQVEIKALREQVKTINARTAIDAKSYERDQYLIARLREQLSVATKFCWTDADPTHPTKEAA